MHTTKYGNKYTDQEWAEMQEYFKEEKKKDEAISAKMRGLEKYLRSQLKQEGFAKPQIDTVVRLFRHGDYEDANIQFTSKARKAKLDSLWQRWDVAMSNLYNEAMSLEDDLEAKRLEIMEGRGRGD